MLNASTLKSKIVSSKNFVVKHKEALTILALTTPVIVGQAKGIQNLNGFLKEKNLFDEYYQLSELIPSE